MLGAADKSLLGRWGPPPSERRALVASFSWRVPKADGRTNGLSPKHYARRGWQLPRHLVW